MKTADKVYKSINIKENEEELEKALIENQKIALESKSASYCYYFARDIFGANKEELFKVVLESGDEYWINQFLKDIYFNKEKFVNYLLFI